MIEAKILGSLGGKARARKTTKKQRVAWGKMGGRPKKMKNNPKKMAINKG